VSGPKSLAPTYALRDIDQKITANNTWGFALIDYFADIAFLRNADDDQSESAFLKTTLLRRTDVTRRHQFPKGIMYTRRMCQGLDLASG